jgi:hypothetical protein
MLVRRVAFLAALLVFTVVLTASIAGQENARDRAVAPAPTPVVRPAPQVDGKMPGDAVVRAAVGDVVSISVRPRVADSAVIEELGVSTDASPQVPGVLEFVPTQPGRFPVILDGTRERLGTLVVSARAAD